MARGQTVTKRKDLVHVVSRIKTLTMLIREQAMCMSEQMDADEEQEDEWNLAGTVTPSQMYDIAEVLYDIVEDNESQLIDAAFKWEDIKRDESDSQEEGEV